MYRSARLRLTAWYAATMLVVLVVLGLGTYLGLLWALDREVDAGIRTVVDEWRAAAPDIERLDALDVEQHVDGQAVDVFLVVFRTDGALVANPRGFEAEELVESGLVRAALAGEEAWATVDYDGRFRIRAVPITQRGRITGALIGGRSLAARDESVRIIVGVLGVVAGSGFAIALTASYVLAGRAMTPLRRAHERERAFVGDASHELRSPLTLMRALGEVLQRGRLDADQRHTVDQLVAVVDEASTLVDDLLVLARAEDPPGAASARADLAAVAGETIERMRPLLEARDIEVERDLRSVVACVSDSDVRRLVGALLENVIAHTPPGTRVRMRGHRADGYAVLSIADAGPGVPEAELGRIFERFAQPVAARTPGGEHGAGLGLAIVAAIAQRWGGQATARGAELGGLEVEVRLPAA